MEPAFGQPADRTDGTGPRLYSGASGTASDDPAALSAVRDLWDELEGIFPEILWHLDPPIYFGPPSGLGGTAALHHRAECAPDLRGSRIWKREPVWRRF